MITENYSGYRGQGVGDTLYLYLTIIDDHSLLTGPCVKNQIFTMATHTNRLCETLPCPLYLPFDN